MAYSPVRRSVFESSQYFLGLAVLLVAGAALLTGCHQAVSDPNDPKFIVAEKGNWQITEGELETEVGNYLKQHQMTIEQVGPEKMPIVKTAMLKNMVLKKLMLDKAAGMQLPNLDKDEAAQLDAIKQKVPPGQDFDQALKAAGLTLDDVKQKIHEQILMRKVLEAEAFKNVDPTEQEIDEIYFKNKASFNIPEKVRASRILILVDDKTSPADKAAKKLAIDKARARVMHGEDFGKVAMEVSQDQYSKGRGGDINFFPKGVNEPGFDEVAFNTKVNTISPVFLTVLGYQFLKVTAIQPAGVVPVADARGYIASKLREMKMEQQSQDYAKNLLATSGVTYHLVLVDPPAQMAPPPDGSGAPNNAPPPSAQDPSSSAPPAPAPAPPAEAPPAATSK
jgi:parvulin-like peptidyl-prolyl isomerase